MGNNFLGEGAMKKKAKEEVVVKPEVQPEMPKDKK